MRKWIWTAIVAVPLAVAGVVYATSRTGGYVCPLSGEVLPCPKCCPLNQ